MSLGKIEVIAFIVLVIVLLFFGSKKLPELARSIGQSGRELKKGFEGEDDNGKGGKRKKSSEE